MNNKFIIISGLLLSLTGCLQTRADLRREGVEPRQQHVSLDRDDTPQKHTTFTPPPASSPNKEPAATNVPVVAATRSDDPNEDFRRLFGRIEVLENQVAQLKDGEKVKALETEIAQLKTKIGLLETTVAELNAKSKKESTSNKKDDDLSEANAFFSEKKWEDAILAYEDFRKKNPKSKHYAEATYKIGQCFQNLGMKDDAKAFYKEVVDKYPSSKEAGLAKGKLKKI